MFTFLFDWLVATSLGDYANFFVSFRCPWLGGLRPLPSSPRSCSLRGLFRMTFLAFVGWSSFFCAMWATWIKWCKRFPLLSLKSFIVTNHGENTNRLTRKDMTSTKVNRQTGQTNRLRRWTRILRAGWTVRRNNRVSKYISSPFIRYKTWYCNSVNCFHSWDSSYDFASPYSGYHSGWFHQRYSVVGYCPFFGWNSTGAIEPLRITTLSGVGCRWFFRWRCAHLWHLGTPIWWPCAHLWCFGTGMGHHIFYPPNKLSVQFIALFEDW